MFRISVHRSNWRAYKACPEIRHHIRRMYLWGFLQKLLWLVMVPILVVSVCITVIGAALKSPVENIVGGTLGLTARKKRQWRTDAYDVLPLEVIQERTKGAG